MPFLTIIVILLVFVSASGYSGVNVFTVRSYPVWFQISFLAVFQLYKMSSAATCRGLHGRIADMVCRWTDESICGLIHGSHISHSVTGERLASVTL